MTGDTRAQVSPERPVRVSPSEKSDNKKVMFNLQKSASRISSFNEIQVNICNEEK